MNYNFLHIEHLSDVLPYIEGRDEFVVAKRDYATILNYNVSFDDTFDIDPSDPIPGIMRRECRGIKFYPNGKIAARPFHKFFNVGQREETQSYLINLSKKHFIQEKRDGSMLHPMMVDGNIRWMTKMGITDVSLQAEKFIFENKKFEYFAKYCIEKELTPIFEYTAPNNQIVLRYEKIELILLAVRENISGKYLKIN